MQRGPPPKPAGAPPVPSPLPSRVTASPTHTRVTPYIRFACFCIRATRVAGGACKAFLVFAGPWCVSPTFSASPRLGFKCIQCALLGARVTPGRSQRRLCGRSSETRLADGHAVRSHPRCINRSLKPTVPVNSTGRFGFCVVGKFSEVICTLGSSKRERTLERGSHR